MTDEEKKQKRREYMRSYRAKNRAKINAYHRKYLSDEVKKQKHVETCKKYRKNSMTDETKAKIKEYQRQYYQKRKREADEEALGKVF